VPTSASDTWSAWDNLDFFVWSADFPADLDPAALLDWQQAVLAAGEETEVYRVEAADPLGYRRDRDGYLGDHVRHHPDPPFFGPGQRGRYLTSTLLTWFDAAGGLVERPVTAIGEAAESAGVTEWAPNPPLLVELGGTPDARYADVITQTDIWFRWNHPRGRDVRHYLDNRRTSGHNAPRLNAFLHRVRAASETLGARWSASPWADPPPAQADASGVLLDASRPDRL
jgi:hypothetical protein